MKKKDKTALAAVVAAVCIIFAVAVLLIPTPRRKSPSGMAAPADTGESSRTLEEMQMFFDARLAPLLLETLPKRQFHLSEIQARYDTLTQMIRERYGKDYALDPRGRYWPMEKQTVVATRIENDIPTIAIFIPSLMDLREAEKKVGVRDEESERGFVVDLLHELDHLAHGFVSVTGEALPVPQRLDNERRAWAETCEHTIRPLLEKRRLSIAPRHFACYQAWVASGRDSNSRVWRSFIDRQYRTLLR